MSSELRDATRRHRARLHERIDALQRSFDDIVSTSDTANLDDEHDPEGTTIAFERAQIIELLRRARSELTSLDGLDVGLDAGSDGDVTGASVRRCDRCEAEIPIERLLALPSTRVCVRCAARRR